ncbi:hypothetical protein [Streptomyces leeuwenhoekii]|uniref:hypothetical protein n=1 Tax=Streptomyces leeuwenhoekii TaxID=1437453 RepID=UPI000AA8458F|nr:hypothetical protein [Streptomyces leeuwenhoekii]
MPELTTRRAYLFAAIRAHGRPVTTQLAERLMARSPWPTTGRNTVRKDLRACARHGLLTAVDIDGRRIYHLITPEGRPPVSATTPMPDHVRVLAQIERGEARAGADAAREIAARHEAAYGRAVWGRAACETAEGGAAA